jgi:hypothetical protein
MLVTAKYNTETKECEVYMDDKLVANLTGFSINKYGAKGQYDCSVYSAKEDGNMKEMQSWCCYATKEQELKAEIQKHICGK